MAESVRCAIGNVLEDLTDEELKKFKTNLHEYPVRPGYDNIPRGRLQRADALDLSDFLVNYYGEEYALEVAAAVLETSNCKPQAQRLLSQGRRQ